GPPRERPQAGQQLADGERLREVVVRARVQPADTVVHRVARREHKYRRAVPPGTHSATDLETVDVGQADVENDEIEFVGGECGERPCPVHRRVGGPCRLPQHAQEEVADFGIVFDDQYTHGGTIANGVERRSAPASLPQGFFAAFVAAFALSAFASFASSAGDSCVTLPTSFPVIASMLTSSMPLLPAVLKSNE